jgi:hypothetical protein
VPPRKGRHQGRCRGTRGLRHGAPRLGET